MKLFERTSWYKGRTWRDLIKGTPEDHSEEPGRELNILHVTKMSQKLDKKTQKHKQPGDKAKLETAAVLFVQRTNSSSLVNKVR